MDTFRQALGLIETWGHLPLINALDAAIKAASVNLTSSHLVGGGLSTATVRGDVGSVKAAMSAAQATLNQIGAQGMTHVIARPDKAIWAMLKKDGLRTDDDGPVPPANSGDQSMAAPPALKTIAGVPAVKVKAEVPAVKRKAEVPAPRPKAAEPILKDKPEKPAVSKAKIIKGYDEYPPVKPQDDRKVKKPRKKK